MREKSEKEKEQNESLERELRPWNAPALIDEMEFELKSQNVTSTKREKGNEKENAKKNKKERETRENTFTQRSQSFTMK